MLFIYLLEANQQYGPRVRSIHSRMKERQDQLLTGSFTFGEVLAGTYRRAVPDLTARVRMGMQNLVAEVVDFTIETAERYAQIRGNLNLAPADAIHLSLASQAGVDLFLTNDKRLLGKFVPGIQFIASLEDKVL
jgi:predicted nucleic acid-binding protein